MNFLGLGPGELFLILLLALIVFGPHKLPEIGAGIGKAVREFRRASDSITQEFSRELQLDSVLQEPRPTQPPAAQETEGSRPPAGDETETARAQAAERIAASTGPTLTIRDPNATEEATASDERHEPVPASPGAPEPEEAGSETAAGGDGLQPESTATPIQESRETVSPVAERLEGTGAGPESDGLAPPGESEQEKPENGRPSR